MGAHSGVDSFLQNLQYQFPFLIEYQYLLFFIGGAIEGLNTMILAGFLASLGHVQILPMMAVLILGYCLNGYGWYAVGYFGGARPIEYWLKKHKKRQAAFERLKKYFNEHTGKAIVITKTTLSFTIITLILAGFLKYNLRKFSWYNLLGSIGWVCVTFFVGYFFGESFEFFLQYFEKFSLLIILSLLTAAVVVYSMKGLGRSLFTRWLAFRDHLVHMSEAVKEGLEHIVPLDDTRRK